MKVREVMRTNVLTVKADDALGVAAQAMLWMGLRHLPVVEEVPEAPDHPPGAPREVRLVGVISERDILRFRSGGFDLGPMRAKVGEAMSAPAMYLDPEDSVTEAAERMAAHKIGCLPVVRFRQIVGILTTTDLLALRVREEYREPAINLPPLAARDVMTPNPVTTRPDEPVQNALARMLLAGVRHLPVVDAGGRLCGILSDRDFHVTPDERGDGVLRLRDASLVVEDLMSRGPITVRADAPLVDLIAAFADWRLTAMPVVDAAGAVLGIVSYVDVLQAFHPKLLERGTSGARIEAR